MEISGRRELRKQRRKFYGVYLWIAFFSLFLNVLMLTGPIYMMQVYDRVLTAKSEATLVALSLIALFLYAIMGALDVVRSRILTRIAGRFQKAMDARIFTATLAYANAHPKRPPHSGLRDLEAVQRLMASQAIHACFDLPWVPLFLVALWAFDPLLFSLALIGGGTLVVIAIMNQRLGFSSTVKSGSAAGLADETAETLRNNSDVIRSMGMTENALSRWQKLRDAALFQGLHALDVAGFFSSLSRTLRLMLQSALLGSGAWLVLHGDLSAGAMIASSVLLGRALAPLEGLIAQWPVIQRGMNGWQSLVDLLDSVDLSQADRVTGIPAPVLQVKEATVIAPDERQALLKMISFDLQPGQACGVIGPSGAGKSSLAKSIAGLWNPVGGSIRLDGLALHQYGHAALGRHIGYLPQSVTLFDGTISENIARLSDAPDLKAVECAARRAGALDMIQALPEGFNTAIRCNRNQLSGGQIQRIGLARALFGDPVMVILDEPNSSLDNHGNEALNAAIKDLKSRGCIVLVMAHRPTAIQECDVLLMIENGTRKAFGPKEEVLRKVINNHARIRPVPDISGAA